MRPYINLQAASFARTIRADGHIVFRPVVAPLSQAIRLGPATARLHPKRNLFSTSALLQQGSSSDASSTDSKLSQQAQTSLAQQNASTTTQSQGASDNGNTKAGNVTKRPKARVGGGKNPLRLVAIKAQQQPSGGGRAGKQSRRDETADPPADGANQVSAVCAADGFDMDAVTRILLAHGFALDPDSTGFEPPEVVHARGAGRGDIFVFPAGTVVTWGLPLDVAESLATQTLLPAAEEPHVTRRETEDLDFIVDAERERCSMKGDDTVVLGTRRELRDGDRLDTTLAQIAFSSGLAQSTKLAVLEASLTSYFESMRRLPENLARGSDLRLNRRFILQKTGELLSLRAQLNHYSELTDSLPDIFWDNRRSELNLESYFDQIGKALDVRIRIRTLNEKMDYAQEMAAVLREMSSQKHSTRLEWIIIYLITIEVLFGLRHIYVELQENKKTTPQLHSQLSPSSEPK